MHAAAGLGRLVEARDVTIRGPELEKAMRVVSWVCLAVLETGCVQSTPTLGGLTHEEFLVELGTMIVAYLGLDIDQPL